MKIVQSDLFQEQRKVKAEDKETGLRLLKARFDSISRDEADQRLTTMPHITSVPGRDGSGLMMLSSSKFDKQYLFGLHGEQVVALAVVDDTTSSNRKEFSQKNRGVIREAAKAFKDYVKQNPLKESEEHRQPNRPNPEAEALLAKFVARSESGRVR